jgi:hypothetical protein
MIFEYPILKLPTTSLDISISAPTDFSLGPARMVYGLPGNLTPYCVDFDNNMLICVTSPEIVKHPFLYKAQRQCSETVIKIPFSDLRTDLVTPTLIFSPGRCGSTLLFSILSALGLPSVSEPDYFRQIAVMSAQGVLQPSPAYAKVMRAATALLGRKLGSQSPIIKLHLACNHAPLLITRTFPLVKVIFIVREFPAWIISLKRVSPNLTAETAVGVFVRALTALYALSQFHEVRILHYQEFAKPDARYVQDIVSFLGYGFPVSKQLLEQVLREDSQQGTSVSRDEMIKREVSRAFIRQAERLWKKERPNRLINELKLEGL